MSPTAFLVWAIHNSLNIREICVDVVIFLRYTCQFVNAAAPSAYKRALFPSPVNLLEDFLYVRTSTAETTIVHKRNLHRRAVLQPTWHGQAICLPKGIPYSS
jgi:hypothetical protein